ncbi:hypothetical protein [Bacillus suaedae]|uniref:Uncharacterized protein n=1 Tax=Halalkalibacter suaedae TaxID=2822140 RepID=A0A940WUE7_9BACI|nr:hypothetical protein [Bacillus suaedae]MBP3951938.1 hypothetical protein [Bacillus suaedae]
MFLWRTAGEQRRTERTAENSGTVLMFPPAFFKKETIDDVPKRLYVAEIVIITGLSLNG